MEKNPIDKQIGVTLRRLRENKNLSRDALGKALPITVSGTAIEKYESGENRISASTLVEIAGILKCKVTDLFEDVPEVMKAQASTCGIPDDPRVREAVANLCQAIIYQTAVNISRKP